MKTVTFYNPGKIDDEKIEFVVISCRFREKWLLCRKKGLNTWEIPGGHREQGEPLDQAAERELCEETGANQFLLQRICPYAVEDDRSVTYGMLYFAAVKSLGSLFAESEMEETALFEKLPECLTYPVIHPRLFHGTQGWLNMQTNADELWDVYDKDRNPTGRTHRRGDFLEEGDYHVVVHVWLLNSNGEFLLTQRAPNKGFPLTWETPGGAAQAGDDSLTAALREVREETGLIAKKENAELLFSFRREDSFADVWLIRQDFDLKDVKLLEGETVDKTYASPQEIKILKQNRRFVPYAYLDRLFEYAKKTT